MYEKILVPVDGSEPAVRGLAEAIRLAKVLGSQLRLLHIVNEVVITDDFGGYTGDVIKRLVEQGKQILEKATDQARSAGVDVQPVFLESLGIHAAQLIIDQASSWPADLIVMGTHGRRGIKRLTLGSDAEQVLRQSHVPVLLVRANSKA